MGKIPKASHRYESSTVTAISMAPSGSGLYAHLAISHQRSAINFQLSDAVRWAPTDRGAFLDPIRPSPRALTGRALRLCEREKKEFHAKTAKKTLTVR
jgi:hypothetical protein